MLEEGPSDEASLRELLAAGAGLTVAMLPASPLQGAGQSPLVAHLARLWLAAGLGPREWQDALRIFENELANQPRQHAKGSSLGGPLPPQAGTHSGGCEVPEECRWTLETFSMFVLKFGVKLRDCQLWFEAFDLDSDEAVGIADFLQGLAATSAPLKAAEGHTARGLCTALVLSRLLDARRVAPDALLARLQTLLAPQATEDFGDHLRILAQQMSSGDLEATRSCPVLASLQESPQLRLQVFGS